MTEMLETPRGMKRENKRSKKNFLDYFDPYVLERYGSHMLQGAERHGSANWKKGGYPKREYLASLERHFLALWKELEGEPPTDEDHAAAIMFNIVGFMYEEHLEMKNEAKQADTRSSE